MHATTSTHLPECCQAPCSLQRVEHNIALSVYCSVHRPEDRRHSSDDSSPVVTWQISPRCSATTVAVVNPICTSFQAADEKRRGQLKQRNNHSVGKQIVAHQQLEACRFSPLITPSQGAAPSWRSVPVSPLCECHLRPASLNQPRECLAPVVGGSQFGRHDLWTVQENIIKS